MDRRIVTSTVCRIRVNKIFLDTNVNTSFLFISDYRYLIILKNLKENAITNYVIIPVTISNHYASGQ